MELPRRHTRIVATLGPASLQPGVLGRMLDAGLDVARLNAGHSDPEHVEHATAAVRQASATRGRHVAVLLDLQGPRIRVGEMGGPDGVELEEGAEVIVTTDDGPGDEGRIPCTWEGLPGDVEKGDSILLDDGLLDLEVLEVVDDRDVRCRVRSGGRLRSHKGINVPGRPLSVPAFSEKDRRDLAAGLDAGVDMVALSFVRRAEDVRELRREIERLESEAWVVAKIEKPQALDCLDEILEASDALMVARGDLGVEMPPERVPRLQKEIIEEADRYGVPVITATQMLESMVQQRRPTRAEASDVANAVFDGTDALMLSAETAVGRYPVEVIRMMDRIARDAEDSRFYRRPPDDPGLPQRYEPAVRAMAWSARRVADQTGVRLIVVYTLSGRTAIALSKLRPGRPVVAFCPDEAICRRMNLLPGVLPLQSVFTRKIDSLLQEGDRKLVETGLVGEGERVVVLGGTMQIPGATNLLQLRRVGGGERG